MTNFTKISQANFRAFTSSNRTQDIIQKKQEIFDELNIFYQVSPRSVLCVGFSSFIFINTNAQLYLTQLDQEMQIYLHNIGVDFEYVEDLHNTNKKFDVVIAVDEYFTYADSDDAQKRSVKSICDLASSYVITTLRDYKNQEYKDREFSQPLAVKTQEKLSIFLESHEWNHIDRNSWISHLFEIENNSEIINYGSFNRRVMYFKQLAKFSLDSGAAQFLVHKNLMYKSLFKKNYEHVITIKF